MYSWILSFFEPSLEGALSSFDAAVKRLEEVFSHHSAKATELGDQATALANSAEIYRVKAQRANAIAGKIKDLIS